MAYEAYVSKEYYKESFNGSVIPDEDIEKLLKQTSRHIDSLTCNRIVGRGIHNLTEFQQELIKEVCCEMAEFEYENTDLIQSVLSSYAINGVSMNFGDSWNVKVISGVAIRADIYDKLSQTGLCCRILRR